MLRQRFAGGARIVALVGALGAMLAPVSAQKPSPELANDEIIRRFTQAESMLRDARNNYTFKQDVLIQTLAGQSAVTGTYRRVSEIVFDDQSKRIERITYFPPPTLRLTVTQEDLQDLGIIQPFALTAEDLPKYNVRFVGRDKIDDIDTYVFEVGPRDPKGMAKRGERYFSGRLWVEDEEYMIVKAAGKAGPEVGEQRFPRFETYREHIDGKFWFPTYTYADDILAFNTGDVHIRMVVKYDDYKEFSGNITVVGEDEPEPDPEP
jgi:hypothetical protein